MEQQGSLFDDDGPGPAFEPCDPSIPEAARPRLSRQCRAIVERLRRGPATNDELSRLSRKYTSRVSDIRKAGYRIKCTALDTAAGLFRYELE
jgi:hypothetical protein